MKPSKYSPWNIINLPGISVRARLETTRLSYNYRLEHMYEYI